MTCKDCIHYELCRDSGTLMYYSMKCGQLTENVENKCPYKKFKNKADYAEVVRCKDCVFYDIAKYDNGTKQVCRLLKRQMQDTDYCSYAKRGEGE